MMWRKIITGAREAALTAGAVLGLVCIIATVAGYAFGIAPLVFRSGSMSPAIHTGDLAVARTVDAASLERGDIVSVIDSGGNRVTHRIQSVAAQGEARQLTLKGDANKTADTEIYAVRRAERVLFTIPKAGYVVDAASGPAGLFVLGAFVSGMLVLAFRRTPSGGAGEDPRPPRSPRGGARKRGKSGVTARSAAVVAVGTTLIVASPASAAFWTNDVPVTGTTLTATTVPAPVVSCGSLGIASVRINWTAVSGATGYLLHYGSGGATSETVSSATLSKTFSGFATSGTFTVQAQHNYGSTTWTSATSNSKNYSVILLVLGTCG